MYYSLHYESIVNFLVAFSQHKAHRYKLEKNGRLQGKIIRAFTLGSVVS